MSEREYHQKTLNKNDPRTRSNERAMEVPFSENSQEALSLSDMPSDLSMRTTPIRTSASITSMDSLASSIVQLSERRLSLLSTSSAHSDYEEEHEEREKELREREPISLHNAEIASPPQLSGSELDYDPSIEPLPTSLPETAALARLTCQQVDEMMTLVLQMIRRMDSLDERVATLLPSQNLEKESPKEEPSKEEKGTGLWFKGILIVAVPMLMAAAYRVWFGKTKGRR